jgi:hypothetical protein
VIGLGGRYRHTVIVNTKDDKSFKGIYWGGRGRIVLLREVSMIENGQPVAVDGEVAIERSNVSFYQRILRV